MSDIDYIYLASPFNHPDEKVRLDRMRKVTDLGFKLTEGGLNVFCPITQSFHLQNYPREYGMCGFYYEERDPKITHEEWMRVDIAFLSKASLLLVYKLPGWRESVGVTEEIQYARDHNIPIKYFDPDWHRLELFIEILKDYLADYYSDQVDATLKEGMSKYKNTINDLAGNTTTVVCEPVHAAPATYTDVKHSEEANKPSIMNFPWGGYDDGSLIGRHMAHWIKVLTHERGIVGYDWVRPVSRLEKDLQKPHAADFTALKINEVFIFGAKKHGERGHLNYTKDDLVLLTNALGRHILKGIENVDEESGLEHRYHALANVFMIRQVLKRED